ncbi:endonuclease/exonuclease/phosphatase family protein [Micromonospora sp. NPDC047670]|uniref:endonuclease/exonuclease/phosphatase family protein n=1 Tax=Micromonospora sp. NPDC047670 TaxID=3364252 RepID=UPI003710DC3B
MRLATFNLLHGRSLTDGLVDPDRLTAAVTALDADVLALQEVDRDQSRSGKLDLTAIAARALGADEHRFAAAVVGTPGEQFRPLRHDDDGHGEPCYGIGLVTRYRVRSWQVTRLRAAPVRSPVYVPGPGGGLTLLHDEPRVVLAAVLDTPHGQLTVAATHLSFVPGWNAHQLRQTVRALRALPAPRILLGDLNLPAGPARLLTGWRPLARRPTYPAGQPRVQLDHILADRHGIDRLPPVTAVHTPLSTISDHRPLLVDLGHPTVAS